MAAVRTFTFDEPEENTAGGGFNDISLAPDDMPDNEPDDDQGQNDEQQSDVHIAEKQPDIGTGGDTPPEQEAAPEDSGAEPQEAAPESQEQQVAAPQGDAQIKMMLAQQQARIDYLTGLLSQQESPQQDATAQRQEQPAPALTEEEIISDPVGSIQRAVDAKIEQYRREQQQEQQEQQHTRQSDANLRAHQEQSWSQLQEQVPAFRNENVQQMWANVFYNPANKLQNDPQGPIKAANQVANMLSGMGITPGQAPAAPAQSAADIPSIESKAAEAERTRQARVKKSAMHGGGKGGNRQKVSRMTPQHTQYAKEFGIDPASVEKVLEGRNV